MSTPLVDVDANPRQPGFKPAKVGSKIPNPTRPQTFGSSDRRSPFSVSMTGSPSYAAVSTTPNDIMSHAPSSKLPRISTPKQSEFSKSYTYGSKPVTPRSSLPRARGGLKPPATTALSSSASRKPSYPLTCNKPLPSPPFAQIIDPTSPAKAQRTLVDAEAGTPTDEQWPILRPEIVSPPEHPTRATNEGFLLRSVSDEPAIRRHVSAREGQATTPSASIPARQDKSFTPCEVFSVDGFREKIKDRPWSSLNPYSQSFHAVSTSSEVAVDSPLACKHPSSPVLLIPPRISSKRDSLPVSGALTDDLTLQSPCVSSRPAKPGSTRWPVLTDTVDGTSGEHANDGGLISFQSDLVIVPESIETTSFTDVDKVHSRSGSIGSVSTPGSGSGPSFHDKSETICDDSFRVKRLSCHSYNNGSGPILRIFADADAIILGQDSTPVPSALTEQVVEHDLQERSGSSIAVRMSKQMLVKMTPTPGSRTSTPSTTRTQCSRSEPVKISPIRSMQPPRKLSIEAESFKSDHNSASTSASLEDSGEHDPMNPQVKSCHSSESPSDTTVSDLQSKRTRQSVVVDMDNIHSSGPSPIASHQYEVCHKPTEKLNTNEATSSQERGSTAEMTSRSASFKSTSTRSKTSPFLLSPDRLKVPITCHSDLSCIIASSRRTHSIPAQADVREPGPSQFGAKKLLSRHPEADYCRRTSTRADISQQSAADTAAKLGAKRSFRNIFHKRDPKTVSHPNKIQASKRSSVTGGALAQRIRGSANFSKASLAISCKAVMENNSNAVLSATSVGSPAIVQTTTSFTPQSAAATQSTQPEIIARHDTATVIHKILDRVTSMVDGSPDRLRGLEIAEAVLNTVECFKEAGVSAELARKHARDAELHADRAGLELKRLAKLCEPCFDDETVQLIKRLITTAGVGRLPEIHAE